LLSEQFVGLLLTDISQWDTVNLWVLNRIQATAAEPE
jgi:hypothetical protein